MKFRTGRPKKIIPKLPLNPKCVLVATGGNLGGAIISLPLISGIRKLWPAAHLAIVSNRQHGLDIVKRTGIGDEFLLAPDIGLKQKLRKWRESSHFNKVVKDLAPDIYIGNLDLRIEHNLPLRSIPLAVGQINPNNCSYGESVYDLTCKYDPAKDNWLDGYWSILRMLGSSDFQRPKIETKKEIGIELIKSISTFHIRGDDKVVALQANVWNRQLFKAWSDLKFAQFGKLLWNRLGLRVIVIGSHGQTGLSNYFRSIDYKIPFIDGVGKFSINELPDVISACIATVSNDSGLMHLSAAVGTPTLAIYGMTDPKVTWVHGQDNNKFKIIRRAKCKPCYHEIIDVESYCNTLDCIKNISVDCVYSQFVQLLDSNRLL